MQCEIDQSVCTAAELVRVDADNQALFEHSIGGLAVTFALFTEPNAFRTFIAASATHSRIKRAGKPPVRSLRTATCSGTAVAEECNLWHVQRHCHFPSSQGLPRDR
jgi:hypothetical protein